MRLSYCYKKSFEETAAIFSGKRKTVTLFAYLLLLLGMPLDVSHAATELVEEDRANPIVLPDEGTVFDVQVNPDNPFYYDFSGVISGTGSLTKTGAGELFLSNDANTYTGPTIVTEGTLRIANWNSINSNSLENLVSGNTASLVSLVNILVGQGSGSGNLDILNGGRATAIRIEIGSGTGSNATATVDGIGSELNAVGGNLYAGNYGTGYLNLTSGGKASATGNIFIANLAGSYGEVVVNGGGSDLSADTGMFIGSTGTGYLSLLDGGTASAVSSIFIGNEAGSFGSATIDGNGSKLITGGDFFIGSIGTGYLSLSNGGKATADSAIRIGNGSGSSGTVTIDGTGSMLSGTIIRVGNYGTGSLTILNGGKVTLYDDAVDYNVLIGYEADSFGTTTVDGDGSELKGYDFFISYSGTGFLNVTNGGKATVDKSVLIGHTALGSGTATVDGSGSELSVADVLWVGVSGKGVLNLTNGGTATAAGDIRIGQAADSFGTVNISGTGSLLEAGTNIYVGESGTGVMDITGGGKATAVDVAYLGYNAGASGTMTVSGSGSTFETTGNSSSIFVGRTGSGTLHILDGGSVSSSYTFTLGLSATSVGVANVIGKDAQDNASSLNVANAMIVGNSGTGTLNIRDGGRVTVNDNLEAAQSPNTSQATINVSGTDSLLSVSKKTYIGFNGTASLNVTDGGSITSVDDFVIGTNSVSTGTVVVKDSGSMIHSDASIVVGQNGIGQLKILDGATADASTVYIGRNATGNGTLTVDGTGSELNSSDYFYVGNSGTGILNLLDGGKAIAANNVYIGSVADSSGTVMIDGVGSELSGDDTISVGSFGTGVLTITNGGKAYATTYVTLGYAASGVGTVTVDGTSSELSGSIYSVGEFGTGTIRLTDGGKVTGDEIYIGRYSGSRGTVQVGNGSTLTSTSGGIYVGGTDTASGGTGFLAGTGTVTANSGAGEVKVWSTGTLSPGDYAGQLGTLTIDGNLTMGNHGMVRIDIDSGNASDLLQVNGAFTNEGTVLNFTSAHVSGTYTVMQYDSIAGGQVYERLNGEQLVGTRNDGAFSGAIVGVNSIDIMITAVTNENNMLWDSTSGGEWNLTGDNWTGNETKFFDGDAVIFDDVDGTITMAGTGRTVAWLAVSGNNTDIVFDGNILADGTKTTLVGQNGKLILDSSLGTTGTVTLKGENEFHGGVTLNGGTLVLGNDRALGSYEMNAITLADSRGQVNVHGDATVKVTEDRTISNRLTINDSKTLTLDIATGKTLTIENVSYTYWDTANNRHGGAIALGAGQEKLNLTSGHLVLRNNSAYNGGGIGSYGYSSADLDFSALQSMLFESNTGTDLGGGFFVNNSSGSVVFGDDVTFRSNLGRLGGGAIYTHASITFGNNTAFISNKTGSSGGAIMGYYDGVELGNNAIFSANEASGSGGAILMHGNLTLSGNTLFENNLAGFDGGAIFTSGAFGAATVTLDASSGSIAFSGNKSGVTFTSDGSGWYTPSGGVANSMHFYYDASLNISGAGNVYFDDPISVTVYDPGDPLPQNVGGNNMTKTGTGFVQFLGANFFNPQYADDINTPAGGGAVAINAGTFRLAGPSASFSTMGSGATFTVGSSATLAGSGTITAEQGFTISSTVSPDADRFEIPDGIGTATPGTARTEVAADKTIGTLTLIGDVELDGMNFLVDLGPADLSDKIAVTGMVTHSDDSTIKMSNWETGSFEILTATGGINPSKFQLDTTLLTGRREAELGGDSTQLLLHTVESNVELTWTGTAGGVWDTTKTNWSSTEGVNDFLDHDSVTFTNAGANKNVTVDAAGVTVSGMNISGGTYSFTGGKITGDPTVKGSAIAAPSGQLEISGVGTVVNLNVEADFEKGNAITGGTLVLGHDKALGTYVTNTNSLFSPGELYVYENVTIQTLENRTITNRFYVIEDFTLSIADGTTLTFSDAENTSTSSFIWDYAGGAMYLNDDTHIDFSGTGSLVFQNNKARYGGAICARFGLTLGNNISFDGNQAKHDIVGRGGAIYADGDITLGNNVSFSNNFVDAIFNCDGGAICTSGNVVLGDDALFSNNQATRTYGNGGAIYFSGNTAKSIANTGTLAFTSNLAGSRGGAVYSEGDLTLSGNVIFDSNQSGTGGAVYVADNCGLTLSGNTLFVDNSAQVAGGAIAVAGGNATVHLDATGGDIAFAGNLAAGAANSVHLEQSTLLTLSGNGNTYFDDPISSGTLGGNSLTKTGSGFVQFVGDNVLNPTGVDGGTVSVSAGTFRVVDGASFTTEGNDASFSVGQYGKLAGAGTLTAEQGFTISGTISPDGDRFEIPNGIGTSNPDTARITIDDGKEIGTLTLVGNVELDAATLLVDLGAANASDKINVTGNVLFNAISTVDLTLWRSGTFTILTSGGTIADPMGHFTVSLGGNGLSARQGATVILNPENAQELLLSTFSNSLSLTWNATDGVWDTTSENWFYSGDATVKTFVDGDAAVFDGTGSKTVTLNTNRTASSMTVSGGEYTFSGTGKISCSDKLNISGTDTVVNLNVETDFSGGYEMSGGTLVLGHDKALGVVNGNDSHGKLLVLGDATLKTVADRLLNNEIVVDNGHLTIDIVSGTTLTFDRTNDSGSLIVGSSTNLSFAPGSGHLVFQNLSFGIGGVGDDGLLDFTNLQSLSLTGSGAVTPFSLGLENHGEIRFGDNVTMTDNRILYGLIVSQGGKNSFGNNVRILRNHAEDDAFSYACMIVTKELTLSGNTLFQDNLTASADAAGALVIVDLLNTSRSALTLDATGGDIVFLGNKSGVDFTDPDNPTGGTASSIALLNADMLVTGSGNVYLDDPISSGTLGGNSFTKTGAGFVQFVGANTLNLAGTPAGTVAVNAGTFRIVNGASFITEGDNATFNLAYGASLSGGGAITAERGFTISGTISPDKARFVVPTNLDGNADTPTIVNGDRIATLTLNGDTVFAGATMQIDLGAGTSDRIDVNGNVTFALDGTRTNTVDIGFWSVGSYTVLSGSSVADITGFFDDVTVGGNALGSRQSAVLSRGAGDTELILTTSGGNNLDLVWTGAASGSWNTTAANWGDGETYNADDTVTFDNGGINQEVDIAGLVQVSGMKVTGGVYRFTGTGSIVGTAPTSTGQSVTGKLEITASGTTVINIATDFVNGTEISTGTVVVGHDAAFGQLGTGNKGHVAILGDTLLRVEADRLLNNRFTIQSGAELTVDVTSGTTLTLDGGRTTDALIVADNGTLNFTDGGYLVLRESGSRAVRGTSFDFTPFAGTTFSRNSTAAQGGAVYVTESLSVSGNTLFTGNTADGPGGALFLAGTGLANFVSLDATGGDILFVHNKSNGVDNSIHLEKNGELRLSGSGNIFFDDPISSGAAGGNNLTKTGAGYVQFVGDNVLNVAGTPAGAVAVHAGSFRVVDGASFTTQGTGSSFGVSSGAVLAGGGSVTAGAGFTISGTISPDSARFGTPASVGTDSPSNSETVVPDADRIGTLTLNGNVYLDGTTLAVDLDVDAITSDRIDIIGNLAYGANSRIDLGAWNIGVYTILTGGGLDLSHFDSAVMIGGNPLGSRQSATLSVDANQLKLTTTGGLSLNLVWTGASNGLWNTTDANWTGGQTYNADDFVIFDASAVNQTVTVSGNVQVSGMEVRSGNYSFEGSKITGTLPTSVGQTVTGRLDLLGGTTRLNLETDFAEGVRLEGGATLIVGQDNALGTDTGFGMRGTLSTVGDGSLRIEEERTLSNRIFVRSGGNLSIASGNALTLDGTNHGSSAVTVETGASLRFIQGNSTSGSGNLAVQNGTDSAFANSGTLDFSGLQSLRITDNRTTNSGGALSSTGTLILGGNTLISGNTADVSGGAVHASNGNVTLNAVGGDIAFTGNTAFGLSNSLHLTNTTLTIAGDRNVFFDDPISSGGGNNFIKSGTGFVQFTGSSTLNLAGAPAGTVAVSAGAFRVIQGATFTTSGPQSTFQVGPGATLAGGGTISSQNGFSISGTISPDSDRLAIPGNLNGSVVSTVSEQKAVGTLRLNGNVLLDGAVLAVNLGNSNVSDKIEVNGDIVFGTNLNLISLYSWTEGTYGILSASGAFDTINDRFRVEYLGQTMDAARLQMSGGTMQLVISQFEPDDFIEWDKETGGIEGDLNPETFPDNVLVHYAGNGNDNVTVTDQVTVAGLIASDGNYHFHSPEKNDENSKVVIRANPEFTDQRFNGKLAVLNGVELEFEVEMDAEYGNYIDNSTVTISHDKALGSYSQNVEDDNNSSGQTTVAGDSEIIIGKEITTVHRTVITSGATLHLTGTDDTAVTFTGVQAEGVDGAAFHVDKDGALSITGHTNITGNSTTGTGGGVYLDGAELTLDSSEGGISITNNVDAGGESDIALNGSDNTIFAVGSEAIAGTVLGTIIAASNSTGNTLIVDTDSFVQVSGNSLLNDSPAFSPFGLMRTMTLLDTWTETEAVMVMNGAWRITESGLFDAGDNTLVSAHSTGTIASGGTVKATQFDIAGRLAPDTAVFRPSSKVIRSELQAGTLTLDGKVRLSDAELTTDLKRNNVSDKVMTTGLITFGDENVVNVNAWQAGTFTVLESLDGFTEDVAADHFGAVLFGGEELVAGGRLSATLTTVGNVLVLETAVSNRMNLRWTGADENGLLNMASTGNWVDENGNAAPFAPTDFLYFDAEGQQGTITLGNADGTTGGRTVSGVIFSGGQYTLQGGDLFGIKTASDDGNLIIADGEITFRNNVFFEGNIYLLGNSTVALEGKNALHADEAFFLAETATLVMQIGDDLLRGKSVTLDGTVSLIDEPLPTTRRSPRFYDMITSTETALDANRLREIFDHSIGLLNRTAVFSEDGRGMDLLYSATSLNDYARDNAFTGNETSYADYFRDTFNVWEMEDFELELMKMNDEQLKTFFGELAEAALLADAKTMALSNPYRVVSRHFIEENDTNRIRSGVVRSSGRTGSTNRFWFQTQQREIEQEGDGNANGYRISRTGMYLGGDRWISKRLLAGFLFGYGNPKMYRQSNRIEMDDLTFAGYAKYRTGFGWDLNAFVGYGSQEYESRRRTLDEEVRGKFDGDAFFTSLEIVRNFRISRDFTLLPTVAVDYGKAWADAFDESGARMTQYYAKSETDQTILRVGLNTRWRSSAWTSLDTRLQYGRRLDDNDAASIRTRWVTSSAAPTTLRGVAIGRDTFNVGVGGHILLGSTGQSRLFGNYDFDRGNRSKAHTAELGFQYAW